MMGHRFFATIKARGSSRLLTKKLQPQKNMYDDGLFSSMRRHCSYIYRHIENALVRLYGTSTNRSYTVAVEGNIGSGKTSLLEYFQSSPITEVYMEPVQKWRNVQGQNALAHMYKDPARWSLTFQTYVQLTMLETHIQKQTKPVKLMERSIYSAKYCFVENLHKNGTMPEIEYVVLSRWFDFIMNNEDCAVDLIVYLQTKPEILFERIKRRGRKEEKPIALEYLQQLHQLHEDWLIHQTTYPLPVNKDKKTTPVIVLDANQDMEEMLHKYEQNKDKILCGYSS